MANFIGSGRGRSKHPRFELDELTDIEPVSHETILCHLLAPQRSPNWMLSIVYGEDRVELRRFLSVLVHHNCVHAFIVIAISSTYRG